MTKFLYTAKSRHNGKTLQGSMEAENPLAVAEYLQTQNCLIINIKPCRWYHQLLNFKTTPKLPPKDLVTLCKALAIMLEAGLTITQALQILINNAGKTRVFLQQTLKDLEKGLSLSTIWQTKKGIPPYLISALQVAEYTGLLSHALESSAQQLEQKILRQEKIQQIILYPCLLLLMLHFILGLMLLEIIPIFKGVFQDMGVDLPFLTKILFVLSDYTLNYSFIIIPLYLGTITLLILSTKTPSLKYLLFHLAYKIPYTAKNLEKLWLIDCSSQLLLLYNAGIPLEENLNILSKTTNNPFHKQRLNKIKNSIQQGKSLSYACQQVGIKNPVFLQLLAVGEETGNLAQTLAYSQKFLQQEVDQLLSSLMTMLEPILILIVGLLVGLFIFALILPLFDIPAAIGV